MPDASQYLQRGDGTPDGLPSPPNEALTEGSGDSSSGPSPELAVADRAIPTSLDAIREPVASELDHFRDYFRESMRSDHMLLDKITQYVLRQKGKRIRPVLVLLSAKQFGDVTETSYRAAALVELLHTATLVHDDVVDDAETRRGMFSINALWKNKIGVLLGDFLLSRGLLLSLDHNDYDMLHTLSDAVRRMSEGELLQIEKSRFLDIDEETYFRIISDKTASLIAACTKAGALSATDDEEDVERMRIFGEKLGLAFQIRDDLFDFSMQDAGKPIGIDLQEKKLTLPVIVALREASSRDRKRIMKIIKKDEKSRSDLREVGTFVADHGGLDYARRRMEGLANEARQALSASSSSPSRDALIGLTEYTIRRKR
ncbi:polyprenyl synthetase [Longibacter salinarum]|uniref:Polyprenyl synthetase n=1 Tax=Longibacter salinarum TaxID=1850348 RepID=A0A2A8CZ90_9BACT|nr:polyprenyl synthetase family protein [Longibacter salinarum]PEN14039.1 polyprenyl synthetase [Longibacter salinarum]